MSSFLVLVSKDAFPEALNALKAAYGEVGAVEFAAIAFRADATVSADDVRAIIEAAAPSKPGHIIVVEARDCSYRTDTRAAFAARLLQPT